MLGRRGLVLLLAIGACAKIPPAGGKYEQERIERAGRGKVVPADVIRATAKGADRLELVEYPWEDLGMESPNKGRKYVVITNPAEISQLLASIQTPRLALSSVGGHRCLGSPPIKLYRGDELLFQFSFDHGVLLRPLSRNLWGSEDVRVTHDSALAVIAWFERHGYSDYRKKIEEEDAGCATRKNHCPPW